MRGSPERARRTRQVVLLSLVGLFVALSVAVTAGAQDGRATTSPAPTSGAGATTTPGSTLVHDSSITVNRSVIGTGTGAPSTFTLTGGDSAATFSLGDGQSSTRPTNSSNTYTLVESTSTDFVSVVSGAGCPQLGRPFTLRAGQNLSCTVLDVPRAGYAIVRIHTETRPDKDPSVFSFDAALALGATATSVPFTLSDGQTSLDLPVPVGGPSSAVIETVPAGWSVSVAGSDPLCAPLGQSDDRRGVNVSPPAGAAGTVINCTFTNTLPATINLTKVTRPTPVSTRFPFTATGVEPQKFTLANGETRSFADVSADQPYTFTESVPIGWFLTVSGDSACVQSGNTLTVSPTPGQVVNCLLTNSNLDLTSISVNKVTVPAGAAQLFDFTASGPLGDSLHFQLADGGTRSLTGITTLLPYTITEAPVPGWRLSTSGSPNCVPITNGVRITPIPFVAVNCTFTNTKLGSIVINKTAIGGNATFGFTAPAPLGSRSITTTGSPGTGKETYPDVAPGTYKITETPLAGWAAGTFSGPGCAADGTVTLAAAQTVTCSITNTKLASISIDKNTVPSGDPTSFGFTTRGLSPAAFELTDASAPQTFTDLVPDTTYTIAETPVAGWSLSVKGSGCTFNGAADTVTVTPKPGQAVACVLTNTKLGSITVDKTSVGGDGTFGFTEATLGPKSVTTTAGAGTVTYSDVPAGTYDLDETALAGWASGSFGGDCGADGTITVGIDQDLTCSITNTARATIIIDKVTDPSGDPTSFDFTATGVTPTSFALTDAAPPRSFADLAPGRSYAFTEATPPGWVLTVSGDAGCVYDADTGTVTVTPAAGAVVNCVFTNTKAAPVTFIVHTLGGDPPSPFVIRVSGSLTTPVPATTPAATATTPAATATTPAATASTLATVPSSAPVTSADDVQFDVSIPVAGGTGQITRSVGPGAYTLAELPKFGWANGTISCVPPTQGPGVLTVTAGTPVTCEVTDIKLASVIIDEATDPPGDSTTFTFGATGGLSPSAFSLKDGGRQRVDNITPGVVAAVNETVPANWLLSTSGDGCTSTASGITIDPAPGQVITCTFVNKKLETAVTFPPVIVPGEPFIITGSGFPPNSTYTVEIVDAAGNSLESVSFTSDANGNVSGQVDLPANFPPGTFTLRVSGPGISTIERSLTVDEPPCPTCAATTAPVAPGSTGAQLGFTGSDAFDLVVWALVLLGLGAGLMVFSRRRRNRAGD